MLVVACTTFGLLVFAPTAIPINGTATIRAGFKNLFQAVCVPRRFSGVYFYSIHPQA